MADYEVVSVFIMLVLAVIVVITTVVASIYYNKSSKCQKNISTLMNINIVTDVQRPSRAFNTKQELLDNATWALYFERIYGLDTINEHDDFPLDFSDAQLLWPVDYALASGGDLPTMYDAAFCPNNNGQLYENMSGGHDVPNSLWWYSEGPFTPFVDNEYVEVTHCSVGDEVVDNEKYGSWMYAAKGSGVWFDLGRTKAFNDHPEAVSFFLKWNCGNKECVDFFPAIVSAALSQGFDSIQFTNHGDMRCSTKSMAMEVLDLHGVGQLACGSAGEEGMSLPRQRYRVGYKGKGAVCNCTNIVPGCLTCRRK